MVTRILLIRHGQTAWNQIDRMQGHAAVPLDADGEMQAEALGQYLHTYLADSATPTKHLYCSDLNRARQTAEIINAYLGLPISFDKRLREIDVGEWQGMNWDEVRAWDSDRFAIWAQDKYANPRPGGESFQDVSRRGCAALEDYAHHLPNQTVLVVTHGGLIREAIRNLLNTQLPHIVPNTSMTILEYYPEYRRWAAGELAQTPHLNGR